MADYREEIAHLESIVNGAVTSASFDGVSTSISIEAARKRLAELKAKDPTAIAAGQTRPRVFKMNVGGAWG